MKYVLGIYFLSLLLRPIATTDQRASTNSPRLRHLTSSNASLTSVPFADPTIDLHGLRLTSIEPTLFSNYPIPISTIILSSNSLSSLPRHLFQPFTKTLTHLNLQRNRFQSLANNAFLRHLGQLRTLDLSNNRLAEIFRQDFLGLRRLDTLILRDNRIDYLADGVFTYCQRVTTLDLSDNRISMIDSHAFRSLKRLKVLLLSNNPLGQRSLTSTLLKPLANLRYLDLENTHLDGLPPFLFLANDRLQSLKLRRNRFRRTIARNASSRLQRAFCGARSLTEIDLVSTNTHSLDVCHYQQLPSLRRLYLMDNPLHCTCDLLYLKYGDVYRLLLDERDQQLGNNLDHWISRPELRRHLEKAHERGDLHRFPVELSALARCATPRRWSGYEIDNITNVFQQCRARWMSVEVRCRNYCQISSEKSIDYTRVRSTSTACFPYKFVVFLSVAFSVLRSIFSFHR